MNTTNRYVIDTQDLGKSYKEVNALKSLNLRVTKHSIFGFLGPNGAGKTTSIKLLLGLTRPTSGGGKVFGLDIVRDSLEIRKRVGHLPQDPRFYEHMTARQTLRFTASLFFSGPKADIEERISEMLGLVGLDDRADRPIRGFSGGEHQRLGIAQAQVNYPELLILDEPAANLDPRGRRDVLEVMERLRKHTTIFYCTHILDDVQRVSDTVAILNHGELVVEAPVEELLAGSGGTTYTVVLKGDPSEAHSRVLSQAWVTNIEVAPEDGRTIWQVSVTDPEIAEAQLMHLVLMGEHLSVAEFAPKKNNLEEVYLDIVEDSRFGTALGD